jgi:hypothetical protein
MSYYMYVFDILQDSAQYQPTTAGNHDAYAPDVNPVSSYTDSGKSIQ